MCHLGPISSDENDSNENNKIWKVLIRRDCKSVYLHDIGPSTFFSVAFQMSKHKRNFVLPVCIILKEGY